MSRSFSRKLLGLVGALSAVVFLIPARMQAQTVVQFQPDVRWGGRANSVTVNPANPDEAIVASEHGGVFKTIDGGATWFHLDGLPMSRVRDVKYAPMSPPGMQIVIATGQADGRVINGGGIWRSTNGGATWRKPTGSEPDCMAQPGAYGIGFEPSGNNVWVGTDCGVSFSRDFGQNWRDVRRPSDDPTPLGGPVMSVAVMGSLVNVGGSWGNIRFGFDGRSFAAAFSDVAADGYHAIAISPAEPSVAFVATNTGLTEIHGTVRPDPAAVLTRYSVGPSSCCAADQRYFPTAVFTSRSRSGRSEEIDVYFSDGFQTWRQTCGPTATPPRCSPDNWQLIATNHSDHMEVAFNPRTRCAQYLVGHGGVYQPTDGGNLRDCGGDWRVTGTSRNGFTALQLYEITGTIVGDRRNPDHFDLYLGTQDNDLFAVRARDTGSQAWPIDIGNEGYRIETPRYSPTDNYKVTWTQPLAGILDSGPHFNDGAWPIGLWHTWRGPGGTRDTHPLLISPHVYAQLEPSRGPAGVRLQITSNDGGDWRLFAAPNVRLQPASWPRVAVSGANATIFLPVSRSALGATVGLIKAVVRTDGTSDPTLPSWNLADGFVSGGIQNIGVVDDNFVWQAVYGVDPNDPNRIIVADVGAGQMKQSRDGGATWEADPRLTALVTGYDPIRGTSEFRFHNTVEGNSTTQARAIAFDPVHRGHILVGTESAGIFRSTDDGRTWGIVPNTRQMPSITSFFFIESNSRNPNDEVLVATFGRGLWKLIIPPGTEVRPFDVDLLTRVDWLPLILRVDNQKQDAEITNVKAGCPACEWFVSPDGLVEDIFVDEEMRVTAVAVGKDRLVASTTDGRAMVSRLPIVKPREAGAFKGCDFCTVVIKRGEPIRGFLLDKGQLRSIIVGKIAEKDMLAISAFSPPVLEPAKTAAVPEDKGPSIFLSDVLAGTQDVVHPGKPITLEGVGFCGKPCSPLNVMLDNKLVSKEVVVDQKGVFRVTIANPNRAGRYTFSATQLDANQKKQETSITFVVPQALDEVETKKKAP